MTITIPDDGTAWAFGNGGFAKLYGDRLAQSSLLDRDVATRWVFLWMLSQADAEGRYRCASVTGLARAANITLEQAEKAVAELEAPDPDSTTKDRDGRRLARIPGGWQLVAYTRYREYKTPRQIAEAARKRRQREAAKLRRLRAKERGRDMSRDVPGTAPQISDVSGQTAKTQFTNLEETTNLELQGDRYGFEERDVTGFLAGLSTATSLRRLTK